MQAWEVGITSLTGETGRKKPESRELGCVALFIISQVVQATISHQPSYPQPLRHTSRRNIAHLGAIQKSTPPVDTTVAPGRLRIGPDWVTLAGNWYTQWERTVSDELIAGVLCSLIWNPE